MSTADERNKADSSGGLKSQVLAFCKKLFKQSKQSKNEDSTWDSPSQRTASSADQDQATSPGAGREHITPPENSVPSVEHTVVELPTPTMENTSVNVEISQLEVPAPQQPKPEEHQQLASLASSSGSVEPTTDQSKNTLVIKNLPFKFKPTDLEKLLNDYQAHPKNVRLLRDDGGRFSGMAFIRCPSKDEAQRLINSMNGLDIGGRGIQVEFKLKKKKKKGALGVSTESVSSLDSSSDSNKLVFSGEHSAETPSLTLSTPSVAPKPETQPTEQAPRVKQLSMSAEHSVGEQQLRKPKPTQPQQYGSQYPPSSYQHNLRRKSMSVFDDRRLTRGKEPYRKSAEDLNPSAYVHSAVPRSLRKSEDPSMNCLPAIRPIRQPSGPDGKSNGFSLEYRRSRTIQH